jgi:hypothetical protein
MEKQKRVYIYEEFITITGDFTEATILSEMFVWTRQKYDIKIVAEEENSAIPSSSFQSGWIQKTAEQMRKSILSSDSSKTVSRKMQVLVNKGLLYRRYSNEIPFNHTYEYRLNITAIRRTFEQNGFNNLDMFMFGT